MPSGLGALLDLSRRALSVQTQALRVIGNNVANANTDGYNRRKVELLSHGLNSQGSGSGFGTGVELNRVIRVVDSFLDAELRTRISSRASAEIRTEFLTRAESPFSLDETVGRIGHQLTEFFSALEDLAADPANVPLRANVLEKGEQLTQSIRTTYNTIADLQREANDRMGVVVDEVNQITAQLAELNAQITAAEPGEQEDLGLLDQREKLLRQLSEKVAVQTVANSDGTLLVTLENGFGLVVGTTARELEFTPSPSFAPGGGFPVGLDGQGLGHIVFDFDDTVGTAHIDLTSVIASSGGELGGLTQLRGTQSTTDTSPFDTSGELVDIAARVEVLTRDLLTRFNDAYLGPTDENGGTAIYNPSSGDLNGNAPGVYGLFTFAGAADSDADGLPDDLTAVGLPNYSSLIQMGVTDASEFAAALDLDGAAGLTSFVDGDGRNITELLNLRDDKVNYSLGPVALTATIEELYDSTVTHVGGLAARASNDLTIEADRELQQEELRAAVSGVNTDEEFAQLINYQRAFEASARMISLTNDLLGEIIGIIQ